MTASALAPRAEEPSSPERHGAPRTAETPVRLLHVLATLQPGGTEISVLRLVRALDPLRYRTHVVCLRGEPVLAGEFRAAGARVTALGLRRALDPLCLMRLRRYVARERIDVVHTHMDVADFYGALAGRLGGARVVVATKHAPDEFRTRRTWKRAPFVLMERLACALDDATIAVSESLRDFLAEHERLPRRRMVVIGHGVESVPTSSPLRPPADLPPFKPLLGAVGRLSPEKGQAVLLRALPDILAAFPAAGCVLVGDGPSRAALEAEAERLGIAGRVRFLGHRSDVDAILRGLDLFVQPSVYEGFGLSLLEAMAAGLPVVASRVGGIPEVVRDGATGLLVPPRDPGALAAALIRLLRDRSAARLLGEAARLHAKERHSLSAEAERIDDLYTRLLAGER